MIGNWIACTAAKQQKTGDIPFPRCLQELGVGLNFFCYPRHHRARPDTSGSNGARRMNDIVHICNNTPAVVKPGEVRRSEFQFCLSETAFAAMYGYAYLCA